MFKPQELVTCRFATWAFLRAEVVGYTDASTDSEQAMMSAVAQQPVSIAIETDQYSFQLYSSGVFTASCGMRIDHGVLTVGYGSEAGTDSVVALVSDEVGHEHKVLWPRGGVRKSTLSCTS